MVKASVMEVKTAFRPRLIFGVFQISGNPKGPRIVKVRRIIQTGW
jgi:hypothetical protein